MLYRSLRVHTIFGANTEIGKTIFSTALCRTSLALGEKVSYLKPVGTGNTDEGDDGHVARFSTSEGRSLSNNSCLFRFQEPVSPHLAAQRETSSNVPSDQQFGKAIKGYADQCHSGHGRQALYIETAGGVHSPTLSGSSQAEAYRPLLTPTILIASPHLGGISTTISAYESLLLRGYSIDAVLCFKEDYYSNWTYLQKYFTGNKNSPVSFASISSPPSMLQDIQEDRLQMHKYYAQVSRSDSELAEIVSDLQNKHQDRLNDLDTAGERTLQHVWWPFVQHADITDPKQVQVIDSAHCDHFSVFDSNSTSNLLTDTFDASASWWTQCLGHAHPELVLAMSNAAGRYGHVIFPTSTHKPALNLTEKLLQTVGKGWASRVFFSDDGSTATEVGIKMALHAYAKHNKVAEEVKPFLGILGLKGSYHGDTIGAMDASEPSVYSKSVEWYRGRGYWFDPPSIQIKNGRCSVQDGSEEAASFGDLAEVYDVQARLNSPLAAKYRERILSALEEVTKQPNSIKFGALVLEPVVMGAGGMIFVDPLFQRVLVDTVRSPAARSLLSTSGESSESWSGLPVVFDEVFTGLYRVGPVSSSHLLGVSPDIACYAKILTGGMLPMSVTLASESIFASYLGEKKTDALLHGHSYTAQPIGCAVANQTLEILGDMDWADAQADWRSNGSQPWSLWNKDDVLELSKNSKVEGVMALGTVLSIQLAGSGGYLASSAAELLRQVDVELKSNAEDPTAIHGRTLGSVMYFMCSLNTPSTVLRKLEQALLSALAKQ